MVNWFKNELFFEYTVIPSLRIEVNADYYERVRKYVYKTKNGIATTKTRKNTRLWQRDGQEQMHLLYFLKWITKK